MEYTEILYETEGPLAWITLNRPAKLNAISRTMVTELNAALDRAEADEQVRVIVVKGEGRAFSVITSYSIHYTKLYDSMSGHQ